MPPTWTGMTACQDREGGELLGIVASDELLGIEASGEL